MASNHTQTNITSFFLNHHRQAVHKKTQKQGGTTCVAWRYMAHRQVVPCRNPETLMNSMHRLTATSNPPGSFWKFSRNAIMAELIEHMHPFTYISYKLNDTYKIMILAPLIWKSLLKTWILLIFSLIPMACFSSLQFSLFCLNQYHSFTLNSLSLLSTKKAASNPLLFSS